MAKSKKTFVFHNVERTYDYMYQYYSMLVDAYDDFCFRDSSRMTPTRRSYILDFKKRVDDLAKTIGIDSEAELPKNINKLQKQNKDDNEEETGQ